MPYAALAAQFSIRRNFFVIFISYFIFILHLLLSRIFKKYLRYKNQNNIFYLNFFTCSN